MICCKAGQTRNSKLVLHLLRSERLLSQQDRSYIADFFEGKFNKRGRPEKVQEWFALKAAANEVERIKREAREQGAKIKHEDAIDRFVEKYPEDNRSAIANKIKNFISRSKRSKKAAQ